MHFQLMKIKHLHWKQTLSMFVSCSIVCATWICVQPDFSHLAFGAILWNFTAAALSPLLRSMPDSCTQIWQLYISKKTFENTNKKNPWMIFRLIIKNEYLPCHKFKKIDNKTIKTLTAHKYLSGSCMENKIVLIQGWSEHFIHYLRTIRLE